ncbi:hypothetical protein [Mycolicibacterium sp. S2-37]|nr:hypothetical protein [Mycolicibacterium sp. S2-37]
MRTEAVGDEAATAVNETRTGLRSTSGVDRDGSDGKDGKDAGAE